MATRFYRETELTVRCRIKINVYRSAGEWYAARWIDGEYDGCDSLEIDGAATEAYAIRAAQEMPLTATGARYVSRVEDLDE